jgi:hypothetical protein
MSSPSQEQSRSVRLREYQAELDAAARLVAVLGAVVRGREVRGWHEAEPPEVRFAASAPNDTTGLPAAVWVALRQDDTATVLDALTAASDRTFVVAEHEQMGEGYRLQTVQERLPLPDSELLLTQLAGVLGIPSDVLAVLGQWGLDDPRTAGEVNALLDSRFGAAGQERRAIVTPGEGLVMSVQEAADVLQLSPAQTKVLTTLVRRVGVTITA